MAAMLLGHFDQAVLRPAFGTRHRLRMKPSIARIEILGATRRTELPRRHRGSLPIVRERRDHGKARPAIRAVDVRVCEAPRAGVAHFLETIVTQRQIGRDRNRWRRHRLASPYDELIHSGWRGFDGIERDDLRRWRRLRPYRVRERLNRLAMAL